MRSMFRKPKTNKLPFITGLVIALFGLVAVSGLGISKVHAACDYNQIIDCGVANPQDFINLVNNGNSRNGHTDLQAIYNHQFAAGQSLSSSQYNDFAANAMAATAYKSDNTIRLSNGQVIATGVSSVGRIASYQGSGYQTYNVNGTNYYGNVNSKAFASTSLPVYVLFNSQGTMTFAVMKDCGNPIFGTVTQTSASCKTLNTPAPVAGQLNTYDFTAAANSAGNATITKYVYDFGDGSPTVTEPDGTTPARHTYKTEGSFTAKVTVYATYPGSNGEVPLTVITDCTKVVKVVIPFGTCSGLNPITIDKDKLIYQFTATASYGNGATFVKTVYDFGDGNTQTVATTDGKTTVVQHQYQQNKPYNISALLYFTINGQTVATANACTSSLTTSTCKEGIPVGDVRCSPCQYDTTLPSDSPQCVPPVLPNTGAGNTIAIFAAVVVAGFLAYRQLLFRKHKAAFAAAQMGTSALPLGDPLNEDAPLTGTPLAPKKRSFRRNRPF